MCDLPEDLQVIKREQRSPLTPNSPVDRKRDHTIKTKLNLHVKRRLQKDYEKNQLNEADIINATPEDNDNINSTLNNTNSVDVTLKKVVRSRKPYKRPEKIKMTSEMPTERKYKYKLKHLIVNKDVVEENGGTNSSVNLETISAGDDDEGSQNDVRMIKDKEKCPDVLAMVLSMKKGALLVDPEVQQFLREIITIFKT